MSTSKGFGEIGPAPPVIQSSWGPRASPVPTPPYSPIQERHDGAISAASLLDLDDYYDVMVVGMSGMGKSTTSDKIIIAKLAAGRTQDNIPNQEDPAKVTSEATHHHDADTVAGQQLPDRGSVKEVVVEQHYPQASANKDTLHTVQEISDKVVAKLEVGAAKLAEESGNKPIKEERKLTMQNLTFWTASSVPEDLKEDVLEYLKSLHFYRDLKDSHLEINSSRSKQETNPITSSCQLVSNEVNRMRVLDVPGFFGVHDRARKPRQSTSLLDDNIDTCTHNHLTIMREILRIQSTMQMAFRRILYFLPGRGPLGRQTMVLRQDLLLLAQYFGPTIFECMVLIATVQPRLSLAAIPGGAFSDEELEDTQLVFKETLEDVLSAYPTHGDPLNPPVVFISLRDTGEDIVEKIQNARVRKEYLELIFDPGVCVKCSCAIRWLENVKVQCIPVGKKYFIPYEDSICHPIFLPKNRRPYKVEVKDGETCFMLSVSREGKQDRESSKEVCLKCGRPPGTVGCLKVGDVYEIQMVEGDSMKITVDHTNHIAEHRYLFQSMEIRPKEQRVEQALDEDNGGSTSELVVSKRTTTKRIYDQDYGQARDQSFHDAFGEMKG